MGVTGSFIERSRWPAASVGARGWLAVLFVALVGCSGETQHSGQPNQAQPDPVNDPAMAIAPTQATPRPAEAALASIPRGPTQPSVPVRRDGKVWFPQTGWVDEKTFWHQYENDPTSIPESLDLHAAHLLRQAYHREATSMGES